MDDASPQPSGTLPQARSLREGDVEIHPRRHSCIRVAFVDGLSNYMSTRLADCCRNDGYASKRLAVRCSGGWGRPRIDREYTNRATNGRDGAEAPTTNCETALKRLLRTEQLRLLTQSHRVPGTVNEL